MEENHSAYKQRNGSTVSSTGDETPRAGHGGGWNGPRRDSGEVEEGESGHRRKNSRLGFVHESGEGRESHSDQTGHRDLNGTSSNKGKERTTNAVSETLPSTALSPLDLTQDKPSPTANVPTSTNQPKEGTGLGIALPGHKTADTELR